MPKTTYRVYLRWPGSRVSNKTVTESPALALAAFRELLNMHHLDGQEIGAALTMNGKQQYFHRFDAKPGEPQYITPDTDLRLP